MFCSRGAVVNFGGPQAENFWENPGFFTQPQAKTILFLGGGQNGAIYIHIFYTACRRRKKFCFFFWVKMGPYIFLHSHRRRKNSGFLGVKMVLYQILKKLHNIYMTPVYGSQKIAKIKINAKKNHFFFRKVTEIWKWKFWALS